MVPTPRRRSRPEAKCRRAHFTDKKLPSRGGSRSPSPAPSKHLSRHQTSPNSTLSLCPTRTSAFRPHPAEPATPGPPAPQAASSAAPPSQGMETPPFLLPQPQPHPQPWASLALCLSVHIDLQESPLALPPFRWAHLDFCHRLQRSPPPLRPAPKPIVNPQQPSDPSRPVFLKPASAICPQHPRSLFKHVFVTCPREMLTAQVSRAPACAECIPVLPTGTVSFHHSPRTRFSPWGKVGTTPL